LGLDSVLLMPAGEAPHKRIEQDPGGRERFLMCELAVRGTGWLDVSQAEVDRPGPSYTVDTLRGLRDARPDDELVWLLGADQAAALPEWREPQEVLRLAQVGVAGRDGVGEETVRDAVSPLAGADRVTFFDMPSIDISSTTVRDRVAAGRPFRFLVPERVADRIEELGLYRGEDA
jgi:nicotinate-nucleotide adenylyltransferase